MRLQQILIKGFSLLLLAGLFSNTMTAQCGTFQELTTAEKDEAREAHVIYRGALKNNKMDEAFTFWEKAYKMAPAADGQRASHYSDGRDLYLEKFKAETDAAKKQEYTDIIIRLYDEELVCYGKDGADIDLLGRKVYDMFYTLNTPYDQTIAAIKDAIKRNGNSTSYTILAPYAHIAQYNFVQKVFSKEEAREVHTVINGIADHNITNKVPGAENYDAAIKSANGTFASIEHMIFDCDYFKAKLEPQYRADPDNATLFSEIYQTLADQGCDKEDPLMKEIAAKDKAIKEKEYQNKMADWEANNPMTIINKLRSAGDADGAIAKCKEVIAESSDPEAQAAVYLLMSDIQYRDKGRYSAAKDAARKAAKLKSGWGKPYIYLGDIIVKQSKSCNSWNQRLAVIAAIDKYSYAKSVDSSVAGDANKRITRYSGSLPEKEEGFSRGYKEGQSLSVSCVGETVKLRYKD